MQTDPVHIACWQRLDARTTTSGRLMEADLPHLAALGVKRVIDLSMPDHPDALAWEGQLLEKYGIDYVHIPVPFDAPGDEHFSKFRVAYEANSEPVHVHCIMNWRASAFFYRYNRYVRKMSDAEARPLMAQQWDPMQSEHPDAPVWEAFIRSGGN